MTTSSANISSPAAAKLAIDGGTPVHTTGWPAWPIVDEADVQAVADVVRGGRWAMSVGPTVDEFEKAFAQYNGARHAIAVNSGASALHVAMAALDIGPGDEVIVPAYTYIASAIAPMMVGATPVLVDVEADTYNLDPAAVKAAITPRTHAIIAVHFSGAAAEMEALQELADRHHLAIIEDAAHSHGGRYAGKALGTIGKAGCFSFQASKNLTSGEGGAILTDDDDLARLCRMYMSNGRVAGGIWYQHYVPGSTFRMTSFQAALLKSQMRRLDEQTRLRDTNGRFLDEQLSRISGISAMRWPDRQEIHSRHLYMFRFKRDPLRHDPRAIPQVSQRRGSTGIRRLSRRAARAATVQWKRRTSLAGGPPHAASRGLQLPQCLVPQRRARLRQ